MSPPMSTIPPTTIPHVHPKQHNLWWVGLLLAVVGAFVSGVGENIVRKSFRLKTETRSRNWPLFIFGWIWVFGIDAGTTVSALCFTSAATVAPTGGLHILSVVFFAKLINDEPLHYADGFGTLFILAGVTGVALLGPRHESVKRLHTLRASVSIVP